MTHDFDSDFHFSSTTAADALVRRACHRLVADCCGVSRATPDEDRRGIDYWISTPHRWPTPQTRGFTNDGDLMALARMCDSWEEMSAMAYRAAEKKKREYWPTPTVCGNYNRAGLSPKSGDGLATAVAKWPTPTTQDAKNNGSASQMNRNSLPLNAAVGGQLSPDWTEWLMGWPIGHTDLKPLATDKFQQWQ